MQLLRMAIAALIAITLDQVSKLIVIQWLDLASLHVLPVSPPYLQFLMAWNEGVDFGMLNHYANRWVLAAFDVLVSLALIAWARNTTGRFMPVAIGFVIGGALGNALDRIAYGAVADFLNMSCCGITNPYSFNVADIFVFLGIAMALVFNGRTPKAHF
ncbi:signal peptidase II (plasmid) [Rhizobium sp. CB3090]|uniref:signal peptidase II n=1 Tax=Rhizobium sp. CB3090 TaxID=3039156 RepID=UPI0024B15BDA|nr:signal peptidase II [Rhizobium sp. CB3090]WFU13310.1 signal peptidase II [Rhizobium sp. CB3090]